MDKVHTHPAVSKKIMEAAHDAGGVCIDMPKMKKQRCKNEESTYRLLKTFFCKGVAQGLL